MGKLSALATETSVTLSDFWVKVKAAGAGDVLVTIQNLVTFLNTNLFANAWLTASPSVVASGGTITTASAAMRYQTIGKRVDFHVDITITTNGTGSGAVQVTLPVTARALTDVVGWGRADGVSGKGLQAKGQSTTLLSIFNYDGTYPGASGEVLRVSGFYEIP